MFFIRPRRFCVDRCRVHDGANRHVLRGDFVSNEIRVRERERRPGEYVHVAEPILDANWHAFVAECLAECAGGLAMCTAWASGNTARMARCRIGIVSLVTDMSGWTGSAHKGFGGKSTFNADISKWDTGKVSNMNHMFYQASAFNQDIGSWNTAQVTRINGMFAEASAFNQDIGSWNTAQVTSMDYMFYSASAFNHDISSWTGFAATTAQTDMFRDATAFQAKFTCTNAVTGPASSCVLK